MTDHLGSASGSTTFIMIKPDATALDLQDKILDLVKGEGFTVVNSWKGTLPREVADELYQEHRGKYFHESNLDFITSGDVVIAQLVCMNDLAIPMLRGIVGNCDPQKAYPGTIRAKYGTSLPRNAAHSPATDEDMERETKLLYPGRIPPHNLHMIH